MLGKESAETVHSYFAHRGVSFAHLILNSLNASVIFVAGRLLLHVRSCSSNALCAESTQGSVGTAWWPGRAALTVEASFADFVRSLLKLKLLQSAVLCSFKRFKTFCKRTLKPFKEQQSQSTVPPSNLPCEPERFNCISAV